MVCGCTKSSHSLWSCYVSSASWAMVEENRTTIENESSAPSFVTSDLPNALLWSRELVLASRFEQRLVNDLLQASPTLTISDQPADPFCDIYSSSR
jgi:hypothetical protein